MSLGYLKSCFLGKLSLLPLFKQDLVYSPLLLIRELMLLLMMMLVDCLLQVGTALLQGVGVFLPLLHVALPPGVHLLNLFRTDNNNYNINMNTNDNLYLRRMRQQRFVTLGKT